MPYFVFSILVFKILLICSCFFCMFFLLSSKQKFKLFFRKKSTSWENINTLGYSKVPNSNFSRQASIKLKLLCTPDLNTFNNEIKYDFRKIVDVQSSKYLLVEN